MFIGFKIGTGRAGCLRLSGAGQPLSRRHYRRVLCRDQDVDEEGSDKGERDAEAERESERHRDERTRSDGGDDVKRARSRPQA